MFDKIKGRDFLYGIWFGPGETTIWLIRRGAEIFLQMFINGVVYKVEHFPHIDDEQARIVSVAYRMLGFAERAVYEEWGDCPKPIKSELLEKMGNYDDFIAKQEKDRLAAEEKRRKAGPGGNVQAIRPEGAPAN